MKINRYNKDLAVDPDDLLIGSDSAKRGMPTKNYRIGDLLDWFSVSGGLNGIAFQYSNGMNSKVNSNTPGWFLSDNTAIKQARLLIINGVSANELDCNMVFQTFKSKSLVLKVRDSGDPTKFGYFYILNIEKNPRDGFFSFEVALFKDMGFGFFKNEGLYFLEFEPLAGGVGRTSEIINDGETGDSKFVQEKELGEVAFSSNFKDLKGVPSSYYEHDQATPSKLWLCQHNLGKYPTVSVMDTAGTLIIGQETHISKVETILKFSSPFSGKAIFIV